MNRSLIPFIIIQLVFLWGIIQAEELARNHRWIVFFLPLHLQSNPVSVQEYILFLILPIALCFYFEWEIIEESK